MGGASLLGMDMKNFTKYLAILIVTIAFILGVLKITQKEQLRFTTAQHIQSSITIPTIAYKQSPKKPQGDTKSSLKLFSQNYLIVKVPKNSHPTALIYNDQKLPLTQLRTTKSITIYKTPPIKRGIDKEAVDVKLLYQKDRGYKIPKSALIQHNNTTYIIVKEHNTLKPLQVTIIKDLGDSIIVAENLKDLQIAIASKKRLLEEFQKLIAQKK